MGSKKNGRKKKFWIGILLILIVAVVVLSYSSKHADSVDYITTEIKKGDIEQSVLATGELDAIRKVDVGAQVNGQLQKLYVDVGDKVKKGQLLALIDPNPASIEIRQVKAVLAQQQAELTQAKAQLQLSEVTFNRKRQLAESAAISQQDLDQAAEEVTVKKNAVKIITAQIAKTKASLDTATLNLNYTQISAPMDGEVVQKTTLEGQTVIASQQAPTILSLADMSSMLVNAEVSEADIIHLKPGQKAWFTVLGDPNKRYVGTLKDIQPTPKKVNNAIFYYARFEVPNEDGVLRLQMTAQINIILAQAKNVLIVPLTALGEQDKEGRYQVEVLLPDGNIEHRTVKIGIKNNVEAQVISGLNAGEHVITGKKLMGDS